MALTTDVNIENFIRDFRDDLTREIARRTKPRSALAELTAELGLLAQSMIDIGADPQKNGETFGLERSTFQLWRLYVQ